MLKKRHAFVSRPNKNIGGAIDGTTSTAPRTRRKSRIASPSVILATGAICLPLLASTASVVAAAPRTTPPIGKQLAELKGRDTVTPDSFGFSAAISGTTGVVGAPFYAKDAGRAYVFSKTSTGWKQVAELKGSNTVADDLFGFSVAISGTTAVVGAPFHPEYPFAETGRAYVFTKTSKGWKQVSELQGSAPVASDDEFGYSAAISGTNAIVGERGYGNLGGLAYVFTETAKGWKQVAELLGSGETELDNFGSSVAISGTTAVVGAPVEYVGGAGRAYVFTKTAKGWKQVAELKGSAPVDLGDEFGCSVAISGTTAVLGASETANAAGLAYVFTKTAKGWKQVAELKGSDTVADDYFGGSVALSGTTAIVGAPYYVNHAGRAYVFKA